MFDPRQQWNNQGVNPLNFGGNSGQTKMPQLDVMRNSIMGGNYTTAAPQLQTHGAVGPGVDFDPTQWTGQVDKMRNSMPWTEALSPIMTGMMGQSGGTAPNKTGGTPSPQPMDQMAGAKTGGTPGPYTPYNAMQTQGQKTGGTPQVDVNRLGF